MLCGLLCSCGAQLLIVVTSPVMEHRLYGFMVVAHGISSCGSRALEHKFSSRGAWA